MYWDDQTESLCLHLSVCLFCFPLNFKLHNILKSLYIYRFQVKYYRLDQLTRQPLFLKNFFQNYCSLSSMLENTSLKAFDQYLHCFFHSVFLSLLPYRQYVSVTKTLFSIHLLKVVRAEFIKYWPAPRVCQYDENGTVRKIPFLIMSSEKGSTVMNQLMQLYPLNNCLNQFADKLAHPFWSQKS